MTPAKIQIAFADQRPPEVNFLGDGTYTVGRDSGDIVLGDPLTSGSHGRLEVLGGTVSYTDAGSTNGSFVRGAKLTAPVSLAAGESVNLGGCQITIVSLPGPDAHARTVVAQPAVAPPAPAQQQPLPAAPAPAPVAQAAPAPVAYAAAAPAAPAPAPVAYAAAPPAAPAPGDASGLVASKDCAYYDPANPVRHSYPLAIESASFGTAVGLLAKTLPYAMVRFGILLAMSIATIIWLGLGFGGLAFLGTKVHPWVGYGWLGGTMVAYGWFWWFVVRYFLYLVKAGHIAVLTELITVGKIGNGDKSMFAYGKSVVQERFGQVNALFALDLLIHGVVRAFNRTLDFVASFIPIPGLSSVVGIVNSVVYAATTYIDETLFSYGLARRDDNPWRSAQDGLVYYAQNSKEVLKTSVWIVILDKVLTVVVWVVMLAPAFAVAFILPESVVAGGTIAALVIAALFASNIRGAFLKPLFLIMVMTKFHHAVRGQAINAEWDAKLTGMSGKFTKIKESAASWGSGTSREAGGAASPAQ